MNRIKSSNTGRKVLLGSFLCIMVVIYFSGIVDYFVMPPSAQRAAHVDPYVLTQEELYDLFDEDVKTQKLREGHSKRPLSRRPPHGPRPGAPSHWDAFDIWHPQNRDLRDSLDSPLYRTRLFQKEFVYARAPYYNESIAAWRKRYKRTKIKKNTIFVLLPAFRDPECNKTMTRIFSQCKFCDDVTVGLVNQIKPSEDQKLTCYGLPQFTKNIRVVHVPSHKVEGPTHARFLASKLWDGEEYILSIDAHEKLTEHWDEKLIQDYNNLKFPSEEIKKKWVHDPPRHLFTMYPRIYSENLTKIENDEVPFICHVVEFHDNGLITQRATAHYNKALHHGYPLPGSLVGAGFIFGHAHWLYDAPFDRYTPFVFHGEELYLALRLWTRGWNIFVAPRNYVTHLYGGKKNTFWTAVDFPYHDLQQNAIKRILYGLNLSTVYPKDNDVDIQYYRLGKNRTLEDWKKFSGIRLVEKQYTPRCGQYFDFEAGEYAGSMSERENQIGRR